MIKTPPKDKPNHYRERTTLFNKTTELTDSKAEVAVLEARPARRPSRSWSFRRPKPELVVVAKIRICLNLKFKLTFTVAAL